MGKIFKITGNYMQYGMWAIPDPSFAGEIVVDDDNTFKGYCDELYESEQPDENKLRFLFGKFGKSKENSTDGLVFLKLSNFERQSPLLYVVHDFEDQSNNHWAALRIHFDSAEFEPQGAATIKIEEVEYSAEREKAILDKYNQIECEDNLNDSMLDCFDALIQQIIE